MVGAYSVLLSDVVRDRWCQAYFRCTAFRASREVVRRPLFRLGNSSCLSKLLVECIQYSRLVAYSRSAVWTAGVVKTMVQRGASGFLGDVVAHLPRGEPDFSC